MSNFLPFVCWFTSIIHSSSSLPLISPLPRQSLFSSTAATESSSSSSKSTSKSSIPAPSGLSYLPFQDEAIQNYLVPSQRILLGDEMGLGKTISIIGGMNVLLNNHVDGQHCYENSECEHAEQRPSIIKPFQTLIVAPKSVLSHWEYELNKWITIDDEKSKKFTFKIGVIKAKQGIPNIYEDDGDESSASSLSCVIYLINYDIVNKYRTEIDAFGRINLLICDECHYLKSVDTQRTHAVFGHHKHTKSMKPIDAERLWLVTGSPVLNNPSELFPLLNAIDLDKEIFPELESIDAFREKYCRLRVTPWGINYKGGKNLSELRKRLSQVSKNTKRVTPIMIRRTKKEVLTDLPGKRHQLFPLDDGGEVSRLENDKLQEILRSLVEKSGKKEGNQTSVKQEESTTDTVGTTVFTSGNLQQVKVVELKKLLKARDLTVSGRKSELIQRLVNSQATSTRIGTIEVEEEKLADDEEITSIRDSALSVLQSAPSDNRSTVLSKILAFKTDSKTAVLGALMKARHQTALSKVPYTIELLEIASSSHKVVVFAHHRDVQDAIYDAFEDRAVALNGDTTMEDRSIAVHRFQTDQSITIFIGCKYNTS